MMLQMKKFKKRIVKLKKLRLKQKIIFNAIVLEIK